VLWLFKGEKSREISQQYEHNQSMQSICYRPERMSEISGWDKTMAGKAVEQSWLGALFYGGHEVLWLSYSPKPRQESGERAFPVDDRRLRKRDESCQSRKE